MNNSCFTVQGVPAGCQLSQRAENLNGASTSAWLSDVRASRRLACPVGTARAVKFVHSSTNQPTLRRCSRPVADGSPSAERGLHQCGDLRAVGARTGFGTHRFDDLTHRFRPAEAGCSSSCYFSSNERLQLLFVHSCG